MRVVRIFVSSPNDALDERRRVGRVVERLNASFADNVRLEAIRWEERFYGAHDGFQPQIPRAGECDIVLALLRGRIGSPLSAAFHDLLPPEERPSEGRTYPSGTAYEILTALRARREGRRGELPDVYVFRWPTPPQVTLDAPDRSEIEAQWAALKRFADDLFLTPDGSLKGAYQTYDSLEALESQVENLLRQWVETHVLKGRSTLWPIETKRSPFRGLEPFGAKHAQVFFGRDVDRRRAIERLKTAAETGLPVQLVIGPSGAGKSSFVRAGLAPWLTRPGAVSGTGTWRMALMRPAEMPDGPVASLAHCLFEAAADIPDHEDGRPIALPELAQGDYPTPQALAALLDRADSASVVPVIRALARAASADLATWGGCRDEPARLLLVVDQLDDLFVAGVSGEQRAQFAALLKALASTGQVWILATLRAEFFEAYLGSPLAALADDERTYTLRPPGLAEMAEIVRGPATAAGLVYALNPATGERLDERLLRDIDRPDLLPLLQFVLERLYEQREGGTDGEPLRLTHAAYEQLGTLDGAIERAAEAALASVGSAEQGRLPRLLRALVVPAHAMTDEAPTGGLTWTLRSVPLAQTFPDEATQRLVHALVDARIIITGDDAHGQAVIGLAHQRVIEAWGRARTIVLGSANFYRVKADLAAQRRRWEEGRRRGELLIPRGISLAEAERLVAEHPDELSGEEAAFVRVSRRRANRAVTAIAAAAVLFGVIAVLAVVAGWYAEQQREEASHQAQAARAQQAIAETQSQIAAAERNRALSAEGVAAQQRDEAERQRLIAEEQTRQARRQAERSEARAELIQAQLTASAAPEDALLHAYAASSRLRSLGSIDEVNPFLATILKSVRTLSRLEPYSQYSLGYPTTIVTQPSPVADVDGPLTIIGTGDISGIIDDSGRAAGAPIGGPDIDASSVNGAAWVAAHRYVLATGAWSLGKGKTAGGTPTVTATNATLRLYETDGTVKQTYLKDHSAPLRSVAVLEHRDDGDTILAGDDDGNVVVIGPSGAPRVIPTGVRAPVRRILAGRYSDIVLVFGPPDPDREGTGSSRLDPDQQKSTISAALGMNRNVIYLGAKPGATVGCAAPLFDGEQLSAVYLCDRNSLKIYKGYALDESADEPELVFTAHGRAVTAIAGARASPIIATGSEDGEIRLWLSDGRLLSEIATGQTNAITALGFIEGGRTLISGSLGGLRRWDVSDLVAQYGNASDEDNSRTVSTALQQAWLSYSDSLQGVIRGHRKQIDELLPEKTYKSEGISVIGRSIVSGAGDALTLIDTQDWTYRTVPLPKVAPVGEKGLRISVSADPDRSICVLRRTDDLDARDYAVTAVDPATAAVAADWSDTPSLRRAELSQMRAGRFGEARGCWLTYPDRLVFLDASSGRMAEMLLPKESNVFAQQVAILPGGGPVAFARYRRLTDKTEIVSGTVSGGDPADDEASALRFQARSSTQLNGKVQSIAASPDGQRLAVAIEKRGSAVHEVRILNSHLDTISVLPGMFKEFETISFSADGSVIRANIKYSGYTYQQDMRIESLIEITRIRSDKINTENAYVAVEQKFTAEKNWEKGIDILEEAYRSFPDSSKFALLLANRYFYALPGRRDRERAMRLYDDAISLDRYHVMAYFMRGKALARLGDDRRAVDDFAQASRLPHILPITAAAGVLGLRMNQGVHNLSLQLNRQAMGELIFRHLYSASRIGLWDSVRQDAEWLRSKGLSHVLTEALDARARDVSGDREGALARYQAALAQAGQGGIFGVEEFDYGKTDPVRKAMAIATYERRAGELLDLLGRREDAASALERARGTARTLLSSLQQPDSVWTPESVAEFGNQVDRIIASRDRSGGCGQTDGLRTVQARDATVMEFVNGRDDPVLLYTYDRNGAKSLVAEIAAGARREQPSVQTQPWLIEDTSHRCIDVSVSLSGSQRMVVQ